MLCGRGTRNWQPKSAIAVMPTHLPQQDRNQPSDFASVSVPKMLCYKAIIEISKRPDVSTQELKGIC